MRVSRAVLVVLGLILAGSAGPVLGDPAGPLPVVELPPWAAVVRSRVARALASLRHIPRGRVIVGFTVTETGEIVDVQIDGQPRIAPRATAALQALGSVPAPPDGRSHQVSVAVRYH